MIDLFFSAFITFFVVIDPPGCAPIYASLTKGANVAQRRNMALRAVMVATLLPPNGVLLDVWPQRLIAVEQLMCCVTVLLILV